MNENIPDNLSPAEPVLREDLPADYPRVAELLQNAPVLEDGCPAVPLVMEDV